MKHHAIRMKGGKCNDGNLAGLFAPQVELGMAVFCTQDGRITVTPEGIAHTADVGAETFHPWNRITNVEREQLAPCIDGKPISTSHLHDFAYAV